MNQIKTLLFSGSIPATTNQTLTAEPMTTKYRTIWFGMIWPDQARNLLGYRWIHSSDPVSVAIRDPSGTDFFVNQLVRPEWYGQGQTLVVPHEILLEASEVYVKLHCINTSAIALRAQGFAVVNLE